MSECVGMTNYSPGALALWSIRVMLSADGEPVPGPSSCRVGIKRIACEIGIYKQIRWFEEVTGDVCGNRKRTFLSAGMCS